MDPDACLREIVSFLAALREGEDEWARADLVEHLRSLADWFERGGFPPQREFVLKEGD